MKNSKKGDEGMLEKERKISHILGLSWLIPLLIGVISLMGQSIYPFGNQTILSLDMSGQYFSFLTHFRQTILEDPSSLFYNFYISLGSEAIGYHAYYLLSPLNLLLFLFPAEHMLLGVTSLTLLKMSLPSLSMAFLLWKKFERSHYGTLLFALSYGLMGYLIANHSNLMWLDALYLLPLLVYGLSQLINKDKPWLFMGILGLIIWSNYYIGFMICLFLPLIFPYFYLTREREDAGLKKSLLLFLTSSLATAGSLALLLWPVWYNLSVSKLGGSSINLALDLIYNPFLLVSKFFIGSLNSYEFARGLPNIFVGSLPLIALLAFMVSKSISRIEKLSLFIPLLVLTVSTFYSGLNNIWHGGQAPVGFVYRYSFLISFLIVYAGYAWFVRRETVSRASQTILELGLLMSVITFLLLPQEYLEQWQLVLTSMTFLGILALLHKGRQSWGLLALVILELGVNAYVVIDRFDQTQLPYLQAYQAMGQDWQQTLKPADNEFYRIEKTNFFSKNDPLLQGLYGVSHYSSTIDKQLNQLSDRLAITRYQSTDMFYGTGTNPFTDSFLGVRYMIANKNPTVTYADTQTGLVNKWQRPDLSYYVIKSEDENFIVYENPDVLPLALGIGSGVRDLSLDESDSFTSQNAIFKELYPDGAGPLYRPQVFSYQYDNLELISHNTETRIEEYKRVDTQQEAALRLIFTPETNDPIYLRLDKDLDVSHIKEVRLNGEVLPIYLYSINDSISSLTVNKAGQEQVLELVLASDSLQLKTPDMMVMDTGLLKSGLESAKAEGIVIETLSSTEITGRVNSSKAQTLLMTLPYSQGWSAKVNGQPVETYQVLGSLLAIDLPAGISTVSYQYHQPYLKEGAVISLVSILSYLLFYKRYSSSKSS